MFDSEPPTYEKLIANASEVISELRYLAASSDGDTRYLWAQIREHEKQLKRLISLRIMTTADPRSPT